ncbi:MAG: DUF4097 family beta strand repeat protein [Clostridia bacterium]|nr:DUF4097 family beta strand repeat protein [Clostridia bacterium]
MKTSTKIWLIIATVLVLLGLAIFAGAIIYSGGNFSGLATIKYETNAHTINDNFNSISIDVSTADVNFLIAENGECKVECFEQENITHTAIVEDGVLKISETDNRTWTDYIGINFNTSKVTVYLPSGEYQNVTINASTSDVNIRQGFTFNSVQIAVTTGDVNVKDVTINEELFISVTTGDVEIASVTAKKITTKGGTGEIELNSTIALEHITIERSTGDIEFSNIDAYELFIKTSTGDIEGSLLSEKNFKAKTSTGKVRVPSTTNGGNCVLQTSTGDIHVSIKNA